MNIDWRILAGVSVLSWGAYNVILKGISGKIAWQMSLFWFVAGYAASVGLFCLMNSTGQKFRWVEPLILLPVLCGVLCGVGAIAYFKALPLAPGSLLMPIIGLFLIVSAIGCLIFYHEPLTWRVSLGIILAAVAIVLLSK